MIVASRFARLSLFVAMLATTSLAVVASRTASGAYERDAWVYSEPAVIYANRVYNRAKPKNADAAYLALVYATYGREYAAYGYYSGDQGYFYSAAYMHYVAFSYLDGLYIGSNNRLLSDARQTAYYAYLFNWWAFAT